MTILIEYVKQELERLDALDDNLFLNGYLPWGKLPGTVPELQPTTTAAADASDAKEEVEPAAATSS